MMPEVGSFLLCLALGVALLLSVYPLWGAVRQDARLMGLARPLASGLFLCIAGAFLVLVHAFVVNDFTVGYVAANSNTLLPVYYRIAATWGAHEGSLLLWVLLLSSWTLLVAIFSRGMPQDALARVLAVMGMINLGFLLFIILTSNPFTRTLPDFPIDGHDLNPMLQDIGLIFHPPLLYMGYVGFSVAFAFAIASLMAGRLDTAWARWSRPWTTAAWVFLTIGIVLGSAWAYYELGWGGWWFWDPVENASFMPWLAGTALMHSLAVTEKRGTFKAWTVLMAPFALMLGIGPLVRWRRDEPQKLWKRLALALVVTLASAILLPWLLQDRIEAMTVVGLLMSVWILVLTLMELHERATHRHSFFRGLRHLSRSHWGMVLGHIGVGVTVIGIAFSTQYSVERDVRMKAGDSIDIHRYHFVFRDVHNLQGPNYSGGVGIIDVSRDGKPEAVLHAEKRFYTAARTMMTEAAIDGGFTRDLYAALGEELDNGSWAVRIYYKPFVRWIWFGGVFMAVGGLLCLLDPRYRSRKKAAREERA